MELTPEQKFEALKLRYQDHVALLRWMTNLDFKIFGGYMTLQLAFASWLSQHPVLATWSRLGLFVIDFTLAFLAARLLYLSDKRRNEVVATLQNVNSALGYNTEGAFLSERALNPPTKRYRWPLWYVAGVFVGFAGAVFVLFGGV